MSEITLSESTQPAKISTFTTLLVSDFHLLCSFVLSHPLYFSYFIFFSPYFIKVFSFLSPLFITTSLLLLALLSHANAVYSPNLLESDSSFLLDVYQRLTGGFRTKFDDEDDDSVCFEEFEVYKMVFQSSPSEFVENPGEECCVGRNEAFVDKFCSYESPATGLSELVTECSDEKFSEIPLPKVTDELIVCEEDDNCDKKVETDLVKQCKDERQKEERSTRSESKVKDNGITIFAKIKKVGGNDESQSTNLGKFSIDGGENSESLEIYGEEADLGSFGSMRKEKEWRRTLACKLFEERHNADNSGEGMDMLWETYESETNKPISQSSNHKNKNKKKEKKEETKSTVREEDGVDDDEYDGYEEGKLCCLQALKFSTGKMRLGMGMGTPNLMKIKKAIKGIGWLQNATKHAKKNKSSH